VSCVSSDCGRVTCGTVQSCRPIPTLRRIHFCGFRYLTSTLKYEAAYFSETSVYTLLLSVHAVLCTLLYTVSNEEVSLCRRRSDCDLAEGKSVLNFLIVIYVPNFLVVMYVPNFLVVMFVPNVLVVMYVPNF
jgi:hypothetical protein